ncbi:uncharacterized protein RJT20DRAFT_124189 [Scheffersomyces xylosifermentans]|uniref:uncharacterized protein n=1 Tax=Scheffersomyces xylosifermentans TaxID=1304137 RepID=UPI00315D56E8
MAPKINKDAMKYKRNRELTFTDRVKKAGGGYTTWNENNDERFVEPLILSGFYYAPTKTNTSRVICSYCGKAETVNNDSDIEVIPTRHYKKSKACSLSLVMLSGIVRDKYESKEAAQEYWENHEESVIAKPLEPRSGKFRLRTFGNAFPLDDKPEFKPNSKSLADAGFISSPVDYNDDRVVCIYCGCSLDNWEAEDIPIEEHIRGRIGYCYYLDLYKASVGDESIAKELTEETETAPAPYNGNQQKESTVRKSNRFFGIVSDDNLSDEVENILDKEPDVIQSKEENSDSIQGRKSSQRTNALKVPKVSKKAAHKKTKAVYITEDVEPSADIPEEFGNLNDNDNAVDSEEAKRIGNEGDSSSDGMQEVIEKEIDKSKSKSISARRRSRRITKMNEEKDPNDAYWNKTPDEDLYNEFMGATKRTQERTTPTDQSTGVIPTQAVLEEPIDEVEGSLSSDDSMSNSFADSEASDFEGDNQNYIEPISEEDISHSEQEFHEEQNPESPPLAPKPTNVENSVIAKDKKGSKGTKKKSQSLEGAQVQVASTQEPGNEQHNPKRRSRRLMKKNEPIEIEDSSSDTIEQFTRASKRSGHIATSEPDKEYETSTSNPSESDSDSRVTTQGRRTRSRGRNLGNEVVVNREKAIAVKVRRNTRSNTNSLNQTEYSTIERSDFEDSNQSSESELESESESEPEAIKTVRKSSIKTFVSEEDEDDEANYQSVFQLPTNPPVSENGHIDIVRGGESVNQDVEQTEETSSHTDAKNMVHHKTGNQMKRKAVEVFKEPEASEETRDTEVTEFKANRKKVKLLQKPYSATPPPSYDQSIDEDIYADENIEKLEQNINKMPVEKLSPKRQVKHKADNRIGALSLEFPVASVTSRKVNTKSKSKGIQKTLKKKNVQPNIFDMSVDEIPHLRQTLSPVKIPDNFGGKQDSENLGLGHHSSGNSKSTSSEPKLQLDNGLFEENGYSGDHKSLVAPQDIKDAKTIPEKENSAYLDNTEITNISSGSEQSEEFYEAESEIDRPVSELSSEEEIDRPSEHSEFVDLTVDDESEVDYANYIEDIKGINEELSKSMIALTDKIENKNDTEDETRMKSEIVRQIENSGEAGPAHGNDLHRSSNELIDQRSPHEDETPQNNTQRPKHVVDPDNESLEAEVRAEVSRLSRDSITRSFGRDLQTAQLDLDEVLDASHSTSINSPKYKSELKERSVSIEVDEVTEIVTEPPSLQEGEKGSQEHQEEGKEGKEDVHEEQEIGEQGQEQEQGNKKEKDQEKVNEQGQKDEQRKELVKEREEVHQEKHDNEKPLKHQAEVSVSLLDRVVEDSRDASSDINLSSKYRARDREVEAELVDVNESIVSESRSRSSASVVSNVNLTIDRSQDKEVEREIPDKSNNHIDQYTRTSNIDTSPSPPVARNSIPPRSSFSAQLGSSRGTLNFTENFSTVIGSSTPQNSNRVAQIPNHEGNLENDSRFRKQSVPKEWIPKPLSSFLENLNNMEETAIELRNLATSEYELHNDPGDLTSFISEMPENEEEMTIKEWVEHCAANCRTIVKESCEEINQFVLKEYQRAIALIESLPTID